MDSSLLTEKGESYSKALGNRQVQMITIGGAIGVGLFLGAGGKLHQVGPSLVLSNAIYVHKWLPDVPQWITALIALGVLLAVNLLSVKLFGELEFWFSVVKVLAIVVFLITALGLVFTSADVGGTPAGVHN